MWHREKWIGRLHASIYWHRDIVGLGVWIKWVRRHFVSVRVLLPMLSFGFAYSLLSTEEALREPTCWVDE